MQALWSLVAVASAYAAFGASEAWALPSLTVPPLAELWPTGVGSWWTGAGTVTEHLWQLGAWLGFEPPSAHATGGARGAGFAFLGVAALLVIAVARMRMVTEGRRLDLARRLVERGLEPPPELLMGPVRRDLRRGIVLVFAGLGMIVAGLLTGDRGLAAGGLVPAFIGIGYLVSYRLESQPQRGPP